MIHLSNPQPQDLESRSWVSFTITASLLRALASFPTTTIVSDAVAMIQP